MYWEDIERRWFWEKGETLWIEFSLEIEGNDCKEEVEERCLLEIDDKESGSIKLIKGIQSISVKQQVIENRKSSQEEVRMKRYWFDCW